MNEEVDKSVFLDEDSDNDVLSLTKPLVSYGVDFALETIRQYVEQKQLVVQPSFQRRYVWDIKKASQLIESFLLGYPVPNILLGRSSGTEVIEVIDGQQRILTIFDFFQGTFRQEKVFRLTGDTIDERFRGKTFSELDDANQRRLKNAVLKGTVVVYPDEDGDVKFTIFQRVNTGSVVLNQQEIRNSIYGGSLNDLMHRINGTNQVWREYVGRKPDKRMRDVETILRFFAANYGNGYDKPMTSYLNKFMRENQNLSENECSEWEQVFTQTLDVIHSQISGNPFSKTHEKRKISRSIFESVMVAVSRVLREGRSPTELDVKHKSLLLDKEYLDCVTNQTSDKRKYDQRIFLAYQYLK